MWGASSKVKSGRMVQVERELESQQRQLNELRHALANVVDIQVHRLHKEQVAKHLGCKAELTLVERHRHEAESKEEELFAALAKKADAEILEEQQGLVEETKGHVVALEQQQREVASSLQGISQEVSKLQEQEHAQEHEQMAAVRERLTALGCNQEQLMAVVQDKVDCKVLENQQRQLELAQKEVMLLQESLAETIRQQLSASLSAEMKSDTLLRQMEEVVTARHREALMAVKEQIEVAESTLKQRFESEIARVLRQQDDHEHRLNAVGLHKGQSEELTKLISGYEQREKDNKLAVYNRLNKKADVEWFEQLQHQLDAAQVSLAAITKDHKEFRTEVRVHLRQLMTEKVDMRHVVEREESLSAELSDLRENAESAENELESLRRQLSEMRDQMAEAAKRTDEFVGSLATKATYSDLETEQAHLKSLRDQVVAAEQQIKMLAYTQATMASSGEVHIDQQKYAGQIGTLVHPPLYPREKDHLSMMPRLPGTGGRRSPYRSPKRRL